MEIEKKDYYAVEMDNDYTLVVAIFKTEEEAKNYSKEWSKREHHDSWVTGYNFGEEIC